MHVGFIFHFHQPLPDLSQSQSRNTKIKMFSIHFACDQKRSVKRPALRYSSRDSSAVHPPVHLYRTRLGKSERLVPNTPHSRKISTKPLEQCVMRPLHRTVPAAVSHRYHESNLPGRFIPVSAAWHAWVLPWCSRHRQNGTPVIFEIGHYHLETESLTR